MSKTHYLSFVLGVSLCTPMTTYAVDFSGYIMVDADQYDGVHNRDEKDSDTELRRLKLSLADTINSAWSYKVKVNIGERSEDHDIDDLYLRYRHDKWRWTIGKHKEPFGMEAVQSSRQLPLIERSMMSQTFAGQRNVGVKLSHYRKRATWDFGLYQSQPYQELSSHYALTGRYTYNWKWPKAQRLHVGASFSQRHFEAEKYRINERAEVHTAVSEVESKKLLTDQLDRAGLELAWQHRQWLLQAEYMREKVLSRDETKSDRTYQGYYVQASYLLNDGKRRYKQGRFRGIKGQESAASMWELAARYSVLDALDNEKGREATNVTWGVNYYYGERWKVMLNKVHTEFEAVSALDVSEGDAVSLRVQYQF